MSSDMGGLLYKDFTAVNGKRMVMILAIFTVIFAALRIWFGSAGTDDFMTENADGEYFNLIDLLYFMGEFFMIYLGAFFVNSMAPRIMEYDEKNRLHAYLFSLPVSRKTYVASKYLFIGIALYITFSLYMIWHVITMAYMMKEGPVAELSQTVAGFALPFICLLLFMEALEMPMYFLFGKEKSMMARVAFWMLIFFVIIWFLMFGDLTIMKNWSMHAIVKWMEKHEFALMMFGIISPVFSLAAYYLSYRISVRLYERKEDFDE